MKYLAVDKDGTEVKIYGNYRRGAIFWYGEFKDIKKLKNESIEKLIGRKLTWEDEPVEIKEDKMSDIEKIKLIVDLTKAKLDILKLKADNYNWLVHIDEATRDKLLVTLIDIDKQLEEL